MTRSRKKARYDRIYNQLKGLLIKTPDILARMATINAVLHYKMNNFFWTGFYMLREGELIVGPYQGPLACQILEKDKGVCWAAVNKNEAVVVPEVDKFPGHIACDSRSKSEITIPVKDKEGKIIAVLDIDSKELNNFDQTDAEELTRIVFLISEYRSPSTCQ